MTGHRQALRDTAREMVAAGQGILAADESNATMTKRLEAVGVESSPDSRRDFRSCWSRHPAPASTSAPSSSTTRRCVRPAATGPPSPSF